MLKQTRIKDALSPVNRTVIGMSKNIKFKIIIFFIVGCFFLKKLIK